MGMPISRAIAGSWPLASPSQAGFSGDLDALLDKAIAEKKVWGLHGLVVTHNGRLVFERYLAGEDFTWGRPLGRVAFGPDTLHDLRSVTKSIVGLLYGVALAAGKVPSLEATLMDTFPEYRDLWDARRARWTVRHLLTMSLGTDWDETSVPYTDPTNSEIAMEMAADRYRFVLGRAAVMEPGKVWSYSGGTTALLGRMISHGTGLPLHQYAREALFEPLGFTHSEWTKGRDGIESAASGLRLTPRDLARIGQLMLDGGNHDGRQVIPREWLEACVTPALQADEFRQFGLHWYMGHFGFVTPTRPGWGRNRLERWWGAFGNGGQRLFVLPGLGLTVAITAGNYETPDQWIPPVRVVREVVLPALA